MSIRRWWPLVALLPGCSNISAPKGQPIALELRLPVPPAVEQNDTLQLQARALDENGDSVATPIYWRAADTTLIMVDSTGLVTTNLTTGSGRVQARAGRLVSTLSSGQLTIRPRSDTVELAGTDTILVPGTDTISAALDAQVLSNNPAGGVSGTTILFEIDSLDLTRVADTAHFAGGTSLLRATTGLTGGPQTAVTVRRSTTSWKDTLHIRVSAARPSGTPVPGSGQRFTILFQ